MRHIITLSTIPPRFAGIAPALKSLLAQSSRPEAVQLYIPRTYRRFPQWGGGLPEVPEGVTIVRVDEDLGPATKILPAARVYRGQELELLYTDDDIYFTRDWALQCLELRKSHPGTVLCSVAFSVFTKGRNWVAESPLPRAIPAPMPDRQIGFLFRRTVKDALVSLGRDDRKSIFAHKFLQSGYSDVAEGFGGVMVRPDFFDDLAYDIPEVLWSVDDVWLSGHLARRGIPIWADRSLNKGSLLRDVYKTFPLHNLVVDGVGRAAADLACIDYMRETYGVWGGEAVQRT